MGDSGERDAGRGLWWEKTREGVGRRDAGGGGGTVGKVKRCMHGGTEWKGMQGVDCEERDAGRGLWGK